MNNSKKSNNNNNRNKNYDKRNKQNKNNNTYAISPYLTGGYGNQLFEIAAAYSYYLDHKCKLVINDTKKVSMGHKQKISNKYSSLPTTVCEMFPKIKCTEEKFKWDRILKQKRNKWYDNIPLDRYVRKDNNSLLVGVFASYMYFKNHTKEVKTLFNFSKDIQKAGEDFKIFDNPKTIGLYFRRGDRYRQSKTKVDFRCSVKISYYYDAINDFIKDHSNYTFVISSEKRDEMWITKHIIPHLEKKEQKYVRIPLDVPAPLSLYLMTLCKNIIISSSTFGFWGAFLNKNKNKIVYAPSVHKSIKNPFVTAMSLRGGIMNTRQEERLPPDWIRIDTECV